MTARKSLLISSLAIKQVRRSYLNLCLASLLVGLTFGVGGSWAETAAKTFRSEKKVIGPTAVVKEMESDFSFLARVDTGATTTSLHVEDCMIEGEASEMAKNVGKTIRFRIKNQRGESQWLKRKIAAVSEIKTSERKELRYKVPVTLKCQDVKKRVLVSLNDRSHMTYPVLLGRNFLRDEFVVDVALGKQHADKIEQPAKLLFGKNP